MTFNRSLEFLVVCGMTLGATPVLAQPPVAPQSAPPQAPAAGAPADLQKEVEDALKELEKLEKVIPDDARELMQQRFMRIGGNGIVIRNGIVIQNGNRFPPTVNVAVAFGMFVERPAPILVEQLKLPPAQGQAINNVRADSLAAKAGLLRHDILLELNGNPVSSDLTNFYKELRDLKPGQEFVASVMRQGKKETVKGFKLPADLANQLPAQPGFAPLQPNAGIFAAPRAPAGRPRIQLAVNGDESTRIQVDGDTFKIDYKGDIRAIVNGKLENGRSTLIEATIQDGDVNVTARTMEQVPERYRATIARILEKVK